MENLKINKLPKNNILKPIVQNPTKMYNFKIRLGRGFSVDELKNSMIPKNIASSIGISLDKRRRGNSLRQPSNIKRLNSYFEKIRSMEIKKTSKEKSLDETEKFIKILETAIRKKFLRKQEPDFKYSNSSTTPFFEGIENLQPLK